MEIIEKQVEKVKEVPTDGCYGYGYGRRDINGKANAGLTLGIIGTALGAWALFGNRRSSGLLGLAGSGSGMGGSNININGLEAAKQLRQQVQPAQQPISQPQRMIWDEIDAEISPMSDEQKTRMLQDEDYVDTYTKIQDMVQAEILSLVKGRIEATPEGKELLQRQLKIVKKLKEKIIQETNREMEMFRKFREFSKTHPEVTYEEFIKASM